MNTADVSLVSRERTYSQLLASSFLVSTMKRRMGDDHSRPAAKKARSASYNHLSSIHEKAHPRNELWMPTKPNFEELASKYPSFASLLVLFGSSVDTNPQISTSHKEGKFKVLWKEEGVLHSLAEALLAEFFRLETSFARSHLAPTVR